MKTLEDIKRRLLDKKADENNTIDLNAYAIGLNEMGKEIEKYAKEVAIASLEKASEKAEIIILSNGELNYDNNFKKKYMNKLCPEDISFKFIKSLAMQDEHAILMRNEEYGIQCEKYTKKINEFQFGKPKIYFFIDGSEKEYTDIQELCNDWNEVKNFDDPNSEIKWIKVIQRK